MTTRVLNWLGFALTPAILALLGYQRRWVTDDAFISFRVAENIVRGDGPTFNIDERVEAHTNPLWVAVLAGWTLTGARIEHGSVALGIALSAIAVALAQLAATRLNATHTQVGELATLPLGALVFAGTPVVWDFVTSGLETGLAFAWLGAAYWTLIRASISGPEEQDHHRYPIAAVTCGLGALVRPDLGVFSVLFFAALIAVGYLNGSLRGARSRIVGIVGAFAAIPAAYQVFRMGYYASLAPNTALAKATGGAQWELGRAYLADVIQPYALWLPLTLLLGWTVVMIVRSMRRRRPETVILIVAPTLAACLHAAYIVRIGGDFMHGRLLLPSFFGLILPVATITIAPRLARRVSEMTRAVLVIAIVVWAVIAAVALRPTPPAEHQAIYVADERSFHVERSGSSHPVTIEDYRQFELPWLRQGKRWRALAGRDARLLVIDPDMPIMRTENPPPAEAYPLSPEVSSDIAIVAPIWNIGMTGYVAGPRVHIVDRYGLADPIASRMPRDVEGRPGHWKKLRISWAIARYADTASDKPFPPDAAVARKALNCGRLAELIAAIEEPLTPRRFIDNIWKSWRFTTLSIDADPVDAAANLCEI